MSDRQPPGRIYRGRCVLLKNYTSFFGFKSSSNICFCLRNMPQCASRTSQVKCVIHFVPYIVPKSETFLGSLPRGRNRRFCRKFLLKQKKISEKRITLKVRKYFLEGKFFLAHRSCQKCFFCSKMFCGVSYTYKLDSNQKPG